MKTIIYSVVLVVMFQLTLYVGVLGNFSLGNLVHLVNERTNYIGWGLYLNLSLVMFAAAYIVQSKGNRPRWLHTMLDLVSFTSPLVGLGGTMIGIAIGISAIDVQDPSSGVEKLFKGVDVSLMTSIIGILLLIVSGVILKLVQFESEISHDADESKAEQKANNGGGVTLMKQYRSTVPITAKILEKNLVTKEG